MEEKKTALTLLVISIVLLGYAAIQSFSQKNQLSVPITAKAALETVKSQPSADNFIKENFGASEDRIERVSLVWDQAMDSYLWEIEIQDRSCGCMLNETEGVTILKATVDPYTGTVHNLSTRVGVPEETIKREACEKGCHVP